jgi:DNA-binding MarR family transcriptional regulator/GNAT superfamily N-acetyltransferase
MPCHDAAIALNFSSSILGSTVSEPTLPQHIEAVRRFSRFYTRRIGVLHEGLLGTSLSLTEGRVIYELAQRDQPTASELIAELGLDPGYLSRILRRFEDQKLVRRLAFPNDARQNLVMLTQRGRELFAKINARSRYEVGEMLARLPGGERARVIEAMATLESLLANSPPKRTAFILRPPRPGDIGWVVHRHGVLYHEEYGWDANFEALVAKVAAKFIDTFKQETERCWIAERAGEIVGSAFVVKKSARTAKLRLLYVEPAARGLGIGRRLVEEAMGFARLAGYKRMTLWTNDVLHAARHIYQAAGFKLTLSEPYRGFGKQLIGETWEREL